MLMSESGLTDHLFRLLRPYSVRDPMGTVLWDSSWFSTVSELVDTSSTDSLLTSLFLPCLLSPLSPTATPD